MIGNCGEEPIYVVWDKEEKRVLKAVKFYAPEEQRATVIDLSVCEPSGRSVHFISKHGNESLHERFERRYEDPGAFNVRVELYLKARGEL